MRSPKSITGRLIKITVAEAMRSHRRGHTAYCDGCRRWRHIPDLSALAPAGVRLDQVEDRLRCTQCGHLGGTILAAGNGARFTYPDYSDKS